MNKRKGKIYMNGREPQNKATGASPCLEQQPGAISHNIRPILTFY